MLLHAMFGGLRWQLMLVYLTFLSWTLADPGAFTMFFSAFVSLVCCFFFPYPTVPRLKGGFAVGIEDFEFKGEVHGIAHSCNVSLFYPSDTRYENDAKSRWFPDGDITAEGYAQVFSVPFHFISYLTRVVANAVSLSPHLKTKHKFRVIVFSHGLGCTRTSLKKGYQSLSIQINNK